MTGRLAWLYSQLPTPGQHLAVTAYGLYWHWARFGRDYESAVRDYSSRDRVSAEEMARMVELKKKRVLEIAALRVPFYREHWTASQRRSALAGRLEDLPLLDKESVRFDPTQFLDTTRRPFFKLTFSTSGSSGTPIRTYWTLRELRDSIALREARSLKWAGVSFRLPRATFSGRLVEPSPNSVGPFYRYNAVERQVYLSPFHLRPETASLYVKALRTHGVRWMTGYAVSFYLLGQFILEQDLPIPPLSAVVTTSEKLTPEMRGVMERAYRCRIYEEYSTVENAAFASECEHGRLHVSPDAGIVEILRQDGTPGGIGEAGEVVATCLFRTYQPLIRYRIGDLAAWDDRPCPCNRPMPILKEVVGRIEDVVVGPDGRQMVRFHGIFVDQPHIREGQIVQEATDRIRVNVVPTAQFGRDDEQDVVRRVRQRLGGQVTVTVQLVDSIPRTQAGKFQAVVCLLSEEEKRRLLTIDAMGRSAISPQPAVLVERGLAALPEQGRSGSRASSRFSNMLSLVGLYHALPPGLRQLAATLQGYRLSALRYGAKSDLLTVEALEREAWSPARWKTWQDERLGHILQRAVACVPYYREQWAERRRRGDKASSDAIKDWPVLKKDALRQNPRAFLADGCLTPTMYPQHTSGTTGTPIHLWRSRESVRAWYALCEARWRRWYGLTRHDRWANIGGQLVVPLAQRRPPFWIWNAPMHQLYMSSYHLASDLIPFYFDALEKYRVKYILGYASSLHSLAVAAREQNFRLQMEVVLTDSEPLYAHQRESISDVFQCPVRETYGMAEAAVAASECTAGKLHLWPEAGVLEVLDWDSDRPVPAGTTGRIVATGLLDPDMPLIRYETGDSGAVDPDEGQCECGRTLPRLLRVEGRNDDILWTKDGRPIGRLAPVFRGWLHIKEAQVVQLSLSSVVVRLAPAAGYSEADERLIADQLKDRLGDIAVGFETLDFIPRERNGKFRAVVCQLSTEERQKLLDGKA